MSVEDERRFAELAKASELAKIQHLDFHATAPCVAARRGIAECLEQADILAVCKLCGRGIALCLNHYATVRTPGVVTVHVCGLTAHADAMFEFRPIGRS